MTFSISARCPESGQFGIAITTSSIAVGARCPHARAGVGVVASQNVTDPRLGPRGLDLMAEGLSAPEALARLRESAPHLEHRQLALVDAAGGTAAFSGARTLGIHATAEGEGAVAAGNLLANESVPAAMRAGFASATGELAGRLLAGLEAGLAAGGEQGPLHSAALLVVEREPFPLVDLRLDWAEEEPIGGLRALWEAYRPQMRDYLNRALDPEAAPAYGVPGDP